MQKVVGLVVVLTLVGAALSCGSPSRDAVIPTPIIIVVTATPSEPSSPTSSPTPFPTFSYRYVCAHSPTSCRYYLRACYTTPSSADLNGYSCPTPSNAYK